MSATSARVASTATVPTPVHRSIAGDDLRARQDIAGTLKLLGDLLEPHRRLVHAGDVLYQSGERFGNLFIVNTGFFKIVSLSPDGREQVVGFKFRGDWLGFDGIAHAQYTCDTVAMDTGEVWCVHYDALIRACAAHPELLTILHQAMSRVIAHDRDSLMAVCTLPANARVADFLRFWAESLTHRGMRADQITLRMTRAEIGNYLGMTLETVSRALSILARDKIIAFATKGGRDLSIPDIHALSAFIQRSLVPVPRAA
ncbi:MAG: Crp/Fnr family transcriptional regulator [Rhodoferax sp.]|nr:Crp/Fnr family transcriptional regulator [Rhodoferax sp.]